MQPHLFARAKFLSSDSSTSLAVVPRSPALESASGGMFSLNDLQELTTRDPEQSLVKELGNRLYLRISVWELDSVYLVNECLTCC